MTRQVLSKSNGSSADIKLARIAQIYRELGEKNLPKGYWIIQVKVTNEEGYEQYKKASSAPLAKFGGKFLARGGPQEVPEGPVRARTVVIEFPNFTAAKSCYESQEYTSARALRIKYSTADVVIVEGCSPES